MKHLFFQFCLIIGMGYASVAHALVLFPEISEPQEVIDLDDPSQQYESFSVLEGFPHLYQISGDTDFTLAIELKTADGGHVPDQRLLLVRELDRGVEEVFRTDREVWTSKYDWWLNERFLHNPTEEVVLSAGNYLIEVSSPTNEGAYSLFVGPEERRIQWGYFTRLGEVYDTKQWLGRSRISIMITPYVYIPLFSLGILYLLYRRFV